MAMFLSAEIRGSEFRQKRAKLFDVGKVSVLLGLHRGNEHLMQQSKLLYIFFVEGGVLLIGRELSAGP